MRGSEGAGKLTARGSAGRALTGGLILALAAGALAFVWAKGLDRVLATNIPQGQLFRDEFDLLESLSRNQREFFLFLGLAMGTGFLFGSLYVLLAWRGETSGTDSARAPVLTRAAGATMVGLVLVLAVAGESLVVTQLRGNVIGWLRGETYRKDLRKSLALRELRQEIRSALRVTGPRAPVVGMNSQARIDAVADFGRDAVPDLVAMLNEWDRDTRRVAVITLARMAPVAPEGPLALIDALRDNSHADVRRKAAEALGQMIPPTRQAVPALVRAFEEDKDVSVRLRAAVALGTILRAPDGIQAAGASGEAQPETAAAVTALVKALRDGDGIVPAVAAEALGMIGPAAKPAGPALLEALKDGKVKREQVRYVLKRIDPEAADKAGFE